MSEPNSNCAYLDNRPKFEEIIDAMTAEERSRIVLTYECIVQTTEMSRKIYNENRNFYHFDRATGKTKVDNQSDVEKSYAEYVAYINERFDKNEFTNIDKYDIVSGLTASSLFSYIEKFIKINITVLDLRNYVYEHFSDNVMVGSNGYNIDCYKFDCLESFVFCINQNETYKPIRVKGVGIYEGFEMETEWLGAHTISTRVSRPMYGAHSPQADKDRIRALNLSPSKRLADILEHYYKIPNLSSLPRARDNAYKKIVESGNQIWGIPMRNYG